LERNFGESGENQLMEYLDPKPSRLRKG
jgi:hypothetical protein